MPSPYPVMLAGVECMAEGHSFHLCNNVILLCYSWAYDKFEQAINRVHRLNSRWPVNVYPIICDGSIDRKLEALIQEKGDAAELVLDGKLLAEHSAEVNLAELLHTARAEFAGKVVVAEAGLEAEWPALRMQLGAAAKAWGYGAASGGRRAELSAPFASVATHRFQITSTATQAVAATPSSPVIVAPAKPRPAVFKPAGAPSVPRSSSMDGLALWQQSSGGGTLPKRPLPFARK